MGVLLRDKDKFIGPSPLEYVPKSDTFNAPGKTIGIRFEEKKDKKKILAPGPGAYNNLGLKNHNYSFSMG